MQRGEISDVASDHRKTQPEARLDFRQGVSGKMQLGIRSQLKPSAHAAMRLGLAEFKDGVGVERIQAT